MTAIEIPTPVDVAFSFLAQDEPLALKMAEQLKGRVTTFVYSERQKELIASDGVQKFTEVFRTGSTLAVVLFRQGWGAGGWTGIEMSAIESRGLKKGWESIVLVNLDRSTPPVWFPDHLIWADVDRYGIEATVAVIEARYRQRHGVVRSESAVERAARLSAEREWHEDRERWLESRAGVDAATAEIRQLYDRLEKDAREITARAPSLEIRGVRRVELNPLRFALVSRESSLSFAWKASGPEIYVREWKGGFSYDGPEHPRYGPKLVGEVHIHPAIDAHGDLCWREKESPDQLYSVAQLAERYMRKLVDRAFSEREESDLRSGWIERDDDEPETIGGLSHGF